MKDVIKKVPIPLCGVMLGAAALGNLLQSYSEGIRYVCGIFAVISSDTGAFEADHVPRSSERRYGKSDHGKRIRNVSDGTYDSQHLCKTVYRKGSLLHMASGNHSSHHSDHILYGEVCSETSDAKVFASYYIVYVGIAVAAVTAPAYEQLGIGTAAFWFGFVTLIVLLVLVTYRYVKFKEVPDPAKPLICIYAAPDQPVYCRLCTVRNTEIIRFPDGNVCSCNGYLYFCPGKSSGISEDAILPKLCSLHIPICYQCDRN